MKTIIRIVVGLGLALVGAVIIHWAILGKRTDVYSVAYCAPQAVVSPIYILNSGYYAEELYHKKRRELQRQGIQKDWTEIYSTVTFPGALMSGTVTALFWLPFLFFRTTKGKSG